jgi:hypothetical protein
MAKSKSKKRPTRVSMTREAYLAEMEKAFNAGREGLFLIKVEFTKSGPQTNFGAKFASFQHYHDPAAFEAAEKKKAAAVKAQPATQIIHGAA